MSRGREGCQIFTDDKGLLRSHVTHSSARVAAVEAIPSVTIRRHNLLWRVLQRAERVGELVRLNGDLPAPGTTHSIRRILSHKHTQAYENNRHGISIH